MSSDTKVGGESPDRGEWISGVVREQDARLASGKQRNARFAADGALGPAEPPPVYMKSDFDRDTGAEKRDAAASNAIMKAKAVSDNKYMSKYKDSVKHLQTILESETDAMAQVHDHESQKTSRMESSYRLVKENEEKIAQAQKTARMSTNATAKGKALSDIHKFHVARRRALRDLMLNSAMHRTDIITTRAARRAPVKGGFVLDEGFHADNDPFCFFC